MLFHDSRRGTRQDRQGTVILLEDQDRMRWDRSEIDEAVDVLERAIRRGRPGKYQFQAAIAAAHARAPRASDTDWPEIARLYGQLLEISPSPVIELNRAVAVAMAAGPSAGLRLIDEIRDRGELTNYHLLHAARADLLRRLNRRSEARSAYSRALELATNEAERRFLAGRLRDLEN